MGYGDPTNPSFLFAKYQLYGYVSAHVRKRDLGKIALSQFQIMSKISKRAYV
jgi:hypothetical protein